MAGRKHGGRSLALALVLMGFSVPFGVVSAEPDSVRVAEIIPVVVTPEAGSARPPEDRKTVATKRVQRCYAKLGYYKGPIDGKASDETWTAHWYFKNDHGLKSHGNFLSKAVQKKIDALCGDDADVEPVEASVPEIPEPSEITQTPEPAEPSEAAASPEPVEPEVLQQPAPSQSTEILPAAPPQSEQAAAQDAPRAPAKLPVTKEIAEATEEVVTARLSEPVRPVEKTPLPPSRLGINCLPEDLLAVVRQAHGNGDGGGIAAPACRRGCLPAPRGLSQTQLDDLYGRYGVVWCRSCVQIAGHLSLDDVRRIEDAGNLDLCATPPRQLPKIGSGNGNVVKSFSRIRELYRALPATPESEGAIAVIIGNSTYDNLPRAQSARNDAGAMYFFLTEHLGFRQDHVIDLRNAKRADFERVFGHEPGSAGELKRLVRAQPDARVVG